jgi:rRNA-processing protein FCF1
MKDRTQINFIADQDVRDALDEIRTLRRPVPSISQAIRDAILNELETLRRQSERKARAR